MRTLAPGLHVAARAERLSFEEVQGTRRRAGWDAPVTRVEAGGGYSIQRNLLVKVSAQIDQRDGGRVRRSRLVAGQLVFWF